MADETNLTYQAIVPSAIRFIPPAASGKESDSHKPVFFDEKVFRNDETAIPNIPQTAPAFRLPSLHQESRIAQRYSRLPP